MLDGGHAGGFVVAVVEMHADRDVRMDLHQRVDQLGQHHVVGVGARAAARLDDDRRLGRLGRIHDGKTLLHVVDVEGRHAVAVFGSVVEKLSQRDAGQVSFPPDFLLQAAVLARPAELSGRF